MKLFNLAILILVIAFATMSCKKCKKENPRARVTNHGTTDVSVQIKTSGGNTTNINNVAPHTSTEYVSYAPGEITFTITVNKVDYTKAVSMAQCYEYDIIIDGQNNISSVPKDRNE